MKVVRKKTQIIYKGKPIKITQIFQQKPQKQEGHGVRYFKH
jgi:hypothetical protein